MKYSIVVAVFNRPDEMDELLASLSEQSFTDFEVVVVEDGSTLTSEVVCKKYDDRLDIDYVVKDNSGPGLSRNYGCERAHGEWIIFLDSDCTVPPGFLEAVEGGRTSNNLDAWGGPDREHPSFSHHQKAVSYSMTSVFTTGGIRGSSVRIGGAFHPRSFNMGISKAVFDTTGGFAPMRFGEDVEFSIRIINHGFNVALIPEAWVYHKRRTDLKKFFRQVHNSGMARINITMRHPNTLKITHFLPAAFLVYVCLATIYTFTLPDGYLTLAPLALWCVVILLHATLTMRSLHIGALSVVTSFIQLMGYGIGFVRGLVSRVILNRPEGYAFNKTYYK